MSDEVEGFCFSMADHDFDHSVDNQVITVNQQKVICNHSDIISQHALFKPLKTKYKIQIYALYLITTLCGYEFPLTEEKDIDLSDGLWQPKKIEETIMKRKEFQMFNNVLKKHGISIKFIWNVNYSLSISFNTKEIFLFFSNSCFRRPMSYYDFHSSCYEVGCQTEDEIEHLLFEKHTCYACLGSRVISAYSRRTETEEKEIEDAYQKLFALEDKNGMDEFRYIRC